MSAVGWLAIGLVIGGSVGYSVKGFLSRRERRVYYHESVRARAETEAVRLLLAGKIDEIRSLLREIRKDGIRYGIILSDWGPEHGEMRWRWTIWDADRQWDLLLPREHSAEGSEVPYMLGNAPTRPLAEAEAMAWIAETLSTSERVVEHG